MKTDTSEKGLETLIMRHLTGGDGLATGEPGQLAESAPRQGGNGWLAGHAESYDREFAVDVEQLFAFLSATQPDEFAKLGIGGYQDKKTIARTEREIALMQEYRTRLTADVVTGKLDVRPLSAVLLPTARQAGAQAGAAAKLPALESESATAGDEAWPEETELEAAKTE